MATERMTEVETLDDAMALTACDLSGSKTLSGNIKLRNTLQKCVGDLELSANGMSAAQLRASKIKRRKVNRDVAMAAHPLKEKSSFDVCSHAIAVSANIESALPIGTNNNSRWNRGDLYRDTKIDDSNNMSTITTSTTANLKSVIGDDVERDHAVEALRKKVMKRLIDVTSPPCTSKATLFRNLMKKTEQTSTIIEMAIEMESSIDDTKKMLMNMSA